MKTVVLIAVFTCVSFSLLGQVAEDTTGNKTDKFTSRLVAGAGLFSGYASQTGELHHYFNNSVPFGLSARLQYGIIVMEFAGSIAFSQLRNDIPYDGGLWEKNSLVSMHFYEFSLGMDVGDRKHLSLCPFAGIGSTDYMRTQLFKDEDYEAGDGELGETLTWSLGMNLDINISKHKSTDDINEKKMLKPYLRFGYRYTFPQFERKYSGFGGNLQFFTAGIYLYGSAMQ